MPRHRVQHVVKEGESGGKTIVLRTAVQVELDGDLGLLGLSLDGGFARHGKNDSEKCKAL